MPNAYHNTKQARLITVGSLRVDVAKVRRLKKRFIGRVSQKLFCDAAWIYVVQNNTSSLRDLSMDPGCSFCSLPKPEETY